MRYLELSALYYLDYIYNDGFCEIYKYYLLINHSDKDTNKRPKPCIWSNWEPLNTCKLVDNKCIRQRAVKSYEEEGGRPCDMEKDKDNCLLEKCCQPGMYALRNNLLSFINRHKLYT